jgi:hypothetical protein
MKIIQLLLLSLAILCFSQGCRKAAGEGSGDTMVSKEKQNSKREKILLILNQLRSASTPSDQERLADELKDARRLLSPAGAHLPTVYIEPLNEKEIPVGWSDLNSVKMVLVVDPFTKPTEYEAFTIKILSPKALKSFQDAMNGPA